MRMNRKTKDNGEKLARLDQLAEKYRDLNKFYKEVKKYKKVFDTIKKLVK